MAFIEPVFDSGASYSGDIIYNNIDYVISDDFIKYIDSMEVLHESLFDEQITGFSDFRYKLNGIASEQKPGTIQIALVSDLPKEICEQLHQLAKACLGGGMSFFISDDNISASAYFCKWENAGEFVENSALLCGGSLTFKFYHRGDVAYVLLQATTPGTAQTGHFNVSGTGIVGTLQAGIYKLEPQSSAPDTDATRPQIYCLTAAPNQLLVKKTDGTIRAIALNKI